MQPVNNKQKIDITKKIFFISVFYRMTQKLSIFYITVKSLPCSLKAVFQRGEGCLFKPQNAQPLVSF